MVHPFLILFSSFLIPGDPSAEVSTALLKSVVANFVQWKLPSAEQKAPLCAALSKGGCELGES